MKKYIFIVCGTISLFLGILGIVVPGLPTTPFVLLTGFLYARSSPKLYARLRDNKLTGGYLRRLETGLSWKVRLFSIAFMWVMVVATAFYIFDENSTMRYVMLGLGVIGTFAQLIALRKRKKTPDVEYLQETTGENSDIDKVEG